VAKTALKLTATNAQTGDKITTNISDVNNDATSTQIRTLAQKLNAFTTNDYYQADAVKTINVDTEEIPTQNSISLAKTTYARSGDSVIIPLSDITLAIGTLDPSTVPSQQVMAGIMYADAFSIKGGIVMNSGGTTGLLFNNVTTAGTYTLFIALAGTNGFTQATLKTQITVT